MRMFKTTLLATALALQAGTGFAQGIDDATARETAEQVDAEMKAAILTLYRSAVRVADDWFADLKHVKAPALILWGERDPYAPAHFGKRLADNVGGAFTAIDAGHWYELEQPELVARALEAFWAKFV